MPIKKANEKVVAICFIVNKSTYDWRDPKIYCCSQLDSNENDHAKEMECLNLEGIDQWSGVFNSSDEFLFEAFALFIGLGISNNQHYEKALKDTAKQQIMMDVLSYHATASISEARCLANSLIPSVRYYNLDKFVFTDIR